MFSTDLRGRQERKTTEAQARAWAAQWDYPAPPAGLTYLQHYAPGAPDGAGASWDASPASLEKAWASGMDAHAAGFGPSRPDGLYDCGHCSGCDFGGPAACHQPQSKAMARLRHDQAEADRIDQGDADLAEVQRIIWREQHRRGQLT